MKSPKPLGVVLPGADGKEGAVVRVVLDPTYHDLFAPTAPLAPVRFVPSRVVGMEGVAEVVVGPTFLELITATETRRIELRTIGRHQWSWLARVVRWLRGRDSPALVADRDWFHAPGERSFTWYTTPPVTTCMPVGDAEGFRQGMFHRIQDVLRSGGFVTYDLG